MYQNERNTLVNNILLGYFFMFQQQSSILTVFTIDKLTQYFPYT